MNDHGEPGEPKLSLQEIFMKIENLPLWAQVRDVAIRGTVPWPSREPYGTAIPGLFELIEQNDGDGLIQELVLGGRPELGQHVEQMLRKYEQVLLPAIPKQSTPPAV